MKIVITYGNYPDGGKYITRVQTLDFLTGKNRTEEQVLEIIQKQNNEYGYDRYVVSEVSEEIGEAFAFVLGEKGYKRTYNIEDICDRLEEVTNAVQELSNDVYDIEEATHHIDELVKKLKEEGE